MAAWGARGALQIQQIHNRMEEKLNELPPEKRQQYVELSAENNTLVHPLPSTCEGSIGRLQQVFVLFSRWCVGEMREGV
jgi:hypothetical protein